MNEENNIKTQKITAVDIFRMISILSIGFVVIYVIYSSILNMINIWVQNPVFDISIDLIILSMWIFIPIAVIFMLLVLIFENYEVRLIKREID